MSDKKHSAIAVFMDGFAYIVGPLREEPPRRKLIVSSSSSADDIVAQGEDWSKVGMDIEKALGKLRREQRFG